MSLQAHTILFLSYLRQNPAVRERIRSAPGRTLLYSGTFTKPIWKEIDDLKRSNPQVAMKETLPDVLKRIPVPGKPYANLLMYVEDLERQVPWKPDGFIVWRGLSGIFASNAVGGVSFSVGSGVTPADKVFAATEIHVLARNPNIDGTTRDVLAYFLRCIQNKQHAMNFGYFSM